MGAVTHVTRSFNPAFQETLLQYCMLLQLLLSERVCNYIASFKLSLLRLTINMLSIIPVSDTIICVSLTLLSFRKSQSSVLRSKYLLNCSLLLCCVWTARNYNVYYVCFINKYDNRSVKAKAKADPLHATVALGGERGIAPTRSLLRY
jgi:hypothetical protein